MDLTPCINPALNELFAEHLRVHGAELPAAFACDDCVTINQSIGVAMHELAEKLGTDKDTLWLHYFTRTPIPKSSVKRVSQRA